MCFLWFLCLAFIEILGSIVYSFYPIWRIFSHYFSKFFFLSSLSIAPITQILRYLKCFHSSLMFCSFFQNFLYILFWIFLFLWFQVHYFFSTMFYLLLVHSSLVSYLTLYFLSLNVWFWRIWASLVAQLVKNVPATQETLVQFLGWEDPLEKGTATHSSIPAMDRGAWRAAVHGVTESDTAEWLSIYIYNICFISFLNF